MKIPVTIRQGHWKETKLVSEAGQTYEEKKAPDTPWIDTSYSAILIDTKIVRELGHFGDWAVIVKMNGTIDLIPLHSVIVFKPEVLLNS